MASSHGRTWVRASEIPSECPIRPSPTLSLCPVPCEYWLPWVPGRMLPGDGGEGSVSQFLYLFIGVLLEFILFRFPVMT